MPGLLHPTIHGPLCRHAPHRAGAAGAPCRTPPRRCLPPQLPGGVGWGRQGARASTPASPTFPKPPPLPKAFFDGALEASRSDHRADSLPYTLPHLAPTFPPPTPAFPPPPAPPHYSRRRSSTTCWRRPCLTSTSRPSWTASGRCCLPTPSGAARPLRRAARLGPDPPPPPASRARPATHLTAAPPPPPPPNSHRHCHSISPSPPQP